MRLQTERLLIRPYTMADVPDAHRIFGDPVVMRDCEPVYDLDKTQRMVQLFMEQEIAFAVVRRADGRVIGHALMKQLPGEEEGIWELGWFFARDCWGKGYAYEAARALMNWGFAEKGLHKICAETIDPVKSLALAHKLGMVDEGCFRQHVRDPQGNWRDLYWCAALNPRETKNT